MSLWDSRDKPVLAHLLAQPPQHGLLWIDTRSEQPRPGLAGDAGDLNRQRNQLLAWHRPPGDAALQCLPFEQFHHDERLPVGVADVERLLLCFCRPPELPTFDNRPVAPWPTLRLSSAASYGVRRSSCWSV